MDEKQSFMEKKKETLKSCRICSKEFSSGNALGGHMRVHTQGSSSHQHSSSVDNGGGCSVCRKHFDSLRSLFGHMRCHPGRHWREILAPQIVPEWGVTGKRGRKGAFPALESDVLEGARDLMFFAGKKQSLSSSSSVDDGIGGDNGLGFGSGYESELDSDGNFFAVRQEREEEQKLKDPIVDPNENPGSGQDRFRCVTCGKEFSSYQALGGHRSKHYKERNCSGPGQGRENGSSREEEKELQGKFVHDPLHWVGPTAATWTGPVEGGMRLQLADLNLPTAAPTSTRDGYGVFSP